MSFLFKWLDLELTDFKSIINSVLESTSFNFSTNQEMPNVPQKIVIKTLDFGKNPPNFELLDVPELTEKKFKGLFKFDYRGELKVVLNAEIEVNSLQLIPFDDFTKPRFVLSDKSTIIPVDFKINNLEIDAILTVVYNGSSVIMVFNDDPIINLEIETSIDELLDEDLLESIKNDALKMATELVKQDLPDYIHNAQILKDPTVMKDVLNREIWSLENVIPSEDLDYDLSSMNKNLQLQINTYDTLSLTPMGFTDVIQRNALSKMENSEHTAVYNQNAPYHFRSKKRKIKIRKLKQHKKELSLGAFELDTRSALSSINTISADKASSSFSSSSTIELEAGLSPSIAQSHKALLNKASSFPELVPHKTEQDIETSFSSPTLVDYSHLPSLENYLNSRIDEELSLDPYEDLLHPGDIELVDSQDYSFEMGITSFENKRKRNTSSNYINLNEFRQFLKNKKDIGHHDNKILN